MAKTLDWIFKLTDRMSGPAAGIQKSLTGVNDTMSKVSKGSREDLLKQARAAQKMRSEQALLDQEFGEGGGPSKYAAALDFMAGAAVAAVAAVGALTALGAKTAIDAAGFRENTVIAFKALLGGQQAAEGLYEKVLDVADRVGLEKGQAVASIKKLISSGFDEAGAVAVLEAIANTSAVLGEGAASKLENFFTIMKSTGKFDLESLKKTGINVDSIYGRLAKTMGKTVDQVKALEKAGKLDASAVTKAVTDEVNKGGIGEALGNTFGRLFGDVVGKFQRLFDKVDLEPIKNAFKAVLGALDGPAGQKLRAGINKIFGGLFDALFGGADAGRVEAIIGAVADVVNMVGDAVVSAAPGIKAFLGGLVDGFTAVWPAIQAAGSAMFWVIGVLGKIPGFWKMVGYGIALVVGLLIALTAILNAVAIAFVIAFVVPIAAVAAAIGWVVSLLADLWEWLDFGDILSSIGSALSGFASMVWEAGAAIISGLVGGILSGASAVIDAIVGVARSAIDAAKSALGIASPSKVFEGLGAFTAEGFASGVANDNSAQDAASSMLEPPSAAGARAAGARAAAGVGAGGGGGGVIVNIEHVDARGAQVEDIENGFASVAERIRLAVNG